MKIDYCRERERGLGLGFGGERGWKKKERVAFEAKFGS